MDRKSKFAYPRMRIRMRMPVSRYPRMRISMRMPVSRYPRMRRIFVTYLNNSSYCQWELLLLQNTDYYIIPNINYRLQSAEDCNFVIKLDEFQPHEWCVTRMQDGDPTHHASHQPFHQPTPFSKWLTIAFQLS